MKDSEKIPSDRPNPSPGDGTGPDDAEPAGPRIVGVGASAGGLEAFEQFFSHLPPDTGLAFVLVPHLDPAHRGMMPELLSRHTSMQVVEAEDGMEVEPNRVYVIPPNADLAVLHGRLQVLEPVAPRGLRTPIDLFLRQLAEDQKERAIGVILSGMGSDGTLGVRAIKEQFGMVMVQDPASAKYDGMPRSALNTGIVDYVASAEELPVKLTQYIHHAPPPLKDRELPETEPPTALQKVFVLLRSRKGNDFSCYKMSTVNRRIERRMGVHQFNSLSRYARYAQENPQEVELLYRELLIGVTNFFRDPELFSSLKENGIPQLFERREAGSPLRVWNPACSTGEETYSLAILLIECLDRLKLEDQPSIQVFATDIDQEAIDKARQGVFPAGIAADVSPERLQRFFVQEDECYRIKKEVRDLVVFAQQNLLVDPPFTKIDLLCCRNLLIYLNAETQKKLLPLMYYALNPGGLLVLGSAESISGFSHLFAPLDTKWKIYQRLEVTERPGIEMPAFAPPREPPAAPMEKTQESSTNALFSAQRALLDRYGPPAVIVNSEGDIVYVSARTGKFLEPVSGRANMNVFAMAREGLREDLGVAVHNAKTRRTAFTVKGVKVRSNGDWTTINLTVGPLADGDTAPGLLLVVFQEVPVVEPIEPADRAPASSGLSTPQDAIEEELLRTRERLQSTIEEMQATQEELRSANEELQSSNEELQSTNEELNSSKEELQSLNEEMQTVNAELQTKMDELSRSNSDMKNLLNGIEIATIFLDNDLAVKRFTPQATEIVNMVPSDVGRPLGHFTTNLKYDGLVRDVNDVADRLVPKELQIEANDGHWYNLRILPYRTVDNVIDGVVMTFSDITELKRLEASFRAQHTEIATCLGCAESIIATLREPVVILDEKLRIVAASRSFCHTFQVASAVIEGRPHYEIAGREWEVPGLRQLVDGVLSKNAQFLDVRVEHDFPKLGHKVLLLNARRMILADRQLSLVLLAIEDITPPNAGPA